MNEGLFTAYHGMPEWERLLKGLKAGNCISVSEIAEGERAFLAAALAHETGRPVLMVCAGELAAQRNAQDVERLTGNPAAVLPARDLQFSRAAMSRESTWQRLKVMTDVLSGRVRVITASVEALLDRCAPPERFAASMIEVADGMQLGMERFMKALIANGYEREATVEGRGMCSQKGSIVDVFPANSEDALRIEFFGDEVDSMRRFDPVSQRSIAKVKNARIAPATECLIADREAAAERLAQALKQGAGLSEEEEKIIEPLGDEAAFFSDLDALEAAEDALSGRKPTRSVNTEEQKAHQNRHLDDVDLVRAGHTIRTAPMWMNVLCEDAVLFQDYLRDPIILLDTPNRFPQQVGMAEKDFEEVFNEAAVRGDAFEAQRQLRVTYDELLSSLKKLSCVTLSDILGSLGRFEPKDSISFSSKPAQTYQSRLEPLAEDISAWKQAGYSVLLLTGGEARGRRLQHALEEQHTPSVYADSLDGNLIARETVLLPVAYTKGFVHPGARLAVVSDSDLYGTAYQRAKKKKNAGERIASFTDLRTGDYVVHDLHGIGIFRGIVQKQSDGVKRDYLQIEYAGADKLYVPADQFDRVSKFIGADQSGPKLNNLGGGEWSRQKSKVKAKLKELAFNLAQLYANRSKTPGYAFSANNPWQQEFDDMFPYELTEDQAKAVAEIHADMEMPRNMDRLLCGDVGYGKTEVALRAVFKCVTEGKQAAILAPTTILVQQHFNTVRKRFAGFPIRFDMLSRFRSPKEQKEIMEKLAKGELDLVIGTHRLLNKQVKYKDLGLLVVDEEQRFGVSHKESIQNMKNVVDVLTMSATPIPRTLHMSMVGIRDLSMLETPPEERLPVRTYVAEYSDAIIREAIRREMARGGQVYFLYNRVRSISQMYERIHSLVPDARIGIAHGQMKESALEDVMLDFYAGAYDVLLCTTIVESGLDVPDANTLIVFDAENFGLSQLYQIRGRVGRSSRQAYAYFTVRAGRQLSETAEQRLQAIREFTEFGAGYRIAMRDLEIRGAGDILGPQQSGHLSTIGYDMYVKLIEESVVEAQGGEVTPELDTRVELDINAFLPAWYVEDEKVRIEVYKRIAMVEDADTRLEIEEELIDRFGDIPEETENLIHIAQLRGITRKLGISMLTLRPEGLYMRFDEHFMPDPMLLPEACNRADKRLRIALGKVPALNLLQKRMTPEQALENGIYVMTRLKYQLGELKKECEAAQQALQS